VLVSSSLFAQRNRGVLDPPETQGIALIVPPYSSPLGLVLATLARLFFGSPARASDACRHVL